MGGVALALALLSCCGVLAAASVMAAFGAALVLDPALWAGAIVIFAGLAAACIAAGARLHHSLIPTALAVTGLASVLHTQLLEYRALVELIGFLLLTGGVTTNVALRRRQQAQVLGLEPARRGTVR